jgi:hypothetical protein
MYVCMYVFVCMYVCFCSAEDQIRSLMHARKALYHWSTLLALGFLRQILPNVIQARLKLVILLPQFSECWDYRCAPWYLAILFKIWLLCKISSTEKKWHHWWALGSTSHLCQ